MLVIISKRAAEEELKKMAEDFDREILSKKTREKFDKIVTEASPPKADETRTKDKVLDIAMNLTKVGGWAAEDYARKRKRIVQFLDETEEYLDDLESKSARDSSSRFQKTFQKFQKEFPRLAKEGKTGPKNSLFWAEEMLTWGTILTHRAKLIS